MRNCFVIAVVLAMITSAGCQKAEVEEPTWQVVAQDSFSEAQAAQREKALAAKDAMAARLKGRLMEVLGAETAAAAIVVCSEEAPQIAATVAQEHGVSMGRTSFRLRNPNNTPPEWATPLVADRIDTPTYLSDGRKLAAFLPIRLEVPCLVCHGPDDGISQEIKDALQKRYPDDQATGFRKGDLRGWFWVEVPPTDGP